MRPNWIGRRRWPRFFLDAPRDRLSLHPDYIALGPKKKSIGVEEIRLLKETLAKKPFSAKLRVCLVEEADTLTVQAQNAMLKMLEEPGDAVFFAALRGDASANDPFALFDGSHSFAKAGGLGKKAGGYGLAAGKKQALCRRGQGMRPVARGAGGG